MKIVKEIEIGEEPAINRFYWKHLVIPLQAIMFAVGFLIITSLIKLF